MRDVIAASLELPPASGASSRLATGGAAMNSPAAKTAAATGRGFGSFMDGCMDGDTGPGESRKQAQDTASGGKHQNGDWAAPASLPVPPAVKAPLALAWSLALFESAPAAGAPDAGDSPVSGPDLAGGSGSELESAVFPQWVGMAGPEAWVLPLNQDDMSSKLEPGKGSRDTTQALGAAPELAFGARLFAPDPSPASGAAGALSSSADTASLRSTPNWDEQAQPKNTEESGTSRGAQAAASARPDTSITGSLRDRSSTSAEDERTPPAPQPDAGSLVVLAPRGVASAMERSPGDHGDNPPAGHADVESVWSPVPPAAADPESQPAGTCQVATAARPAEAEAPEPAAQPASRDVSLHLADGDSSVDIRMAERAGEIRVTVHTPDRDLADSLRADLPDLVGKLRQSGFQAEAWRPTAGTLSDTGRRSTSDASPSQEQSSGNRKDGRQRPPQQQQPKNQSRWAGEWKSSLEPAQ